MFASYLIRFRPLPPIDSRFVAYYLKTPDYWSAITDRSAGIALQNVNACKLETIEMPVAPAAEQQRIVAKLDELTSSLDAGVFALKRARANLKRYRAAILKAAVEGRLTAAWREAHPDTEPADKLLARILTERRKRWEATQLAKYAERGQTPPKGWEKKYPEPIRANLHDLPSLSAGWCWGTLDQLTDIGTGATPLRGNDRFWKDGTVAWVSSGVVGARIVTAPTAYVTEAALRETNLSMYPPGTLLMAMYGLLLVQWTPT